MEKKTEFYMTAGIAADMDSDISFASEISSIIHQFIKVKSFPCTHSCPTR